MSHPAGGPAQKLSRETTVNEQLNEPSNPSYAVRSDAIVAPAVAPLAVPLHL